MVADANRPISFVAWVLDCFHRGISIGAIYICPVLDNQIEAGKFKSERWQRGMASARVQLSVDFTNERSGYRDEWEPG